MQSRQSQIIIENQAMTCVKSNLLLYTDGFFNHGQNGRHGRRGHPGTYKIQKFSPIFAQLVLIIFPIQFRWPRHHCLLHSCSPGAGWISSWGTSEDKSCDNTYVSMRSVLVFVSHMSAVIFVCEIDLKNDMQTWLNSAPG